MGGSAADNDPIDKISGTLGLSGGSDSLLILDRDSNGATLYGRGRGPRPPPPERSPGHDDIPGAPLDMIGPKFQRRGFLGGEIVPAIDRRDAFNLTALMIENRLDMPGRDAKPGAPPVQFNRAAKVEKWIIATRL